MFVEDNLVVYGLHYLFDYSSTSLSSYLPGQTRNAPSKSKELTLRRMWEEDLGNWRKKIGFCCQFEQFKLMANL